MFVLLGTESGLSIRASVDQFALGAASYLHRLIGLALFGLGYALHRKEQRSADTMGLDRPNGWIAGLVCIAAGTVWLIALDRLVAV